jgi:hypothetical protein
MSLVYPDAPARRPYVTLSLSKGAHDAALESRRAPFDKLRVTKAKPRRGKPFDKLGSTRPLEIVASRANALG